MTAHDWNLWTWWSATRGTPTIPARWEDLHTFLVDVPCAPATAVRRISTIRAAHLAERTRITGEPERPTPPPVVERSVVGEVLHHIPVYGFPHGFRGRRDALILVATSLGMTPTQIVAMAPADVGTYPLPAIGGQDLDYDPNHGMRCPSCALTRWLRALSAWHSQLHDAQWRALELLIEDAPVNARVHDCATEVPDGWQQAPTLIPSIDRAGTPDLRQPVTSRSVNSILREHRDHAAEPKQPAGDTPAQGGPPPPSPAAPTPRDRHHELQAIDEALDRLDALLAHVAIGSSQPASTCPSDRSGFSDAPHEPRPGKT